MELINPRWKRIMEDCKARARDQGLVFGDETLEFLVTNEDMIRLSPKGMIPTLYDYWVNDIHVLQDKGKYELYPHNPYETVINTRPPLSFYNDNNPDWLNVMIFYHVLGHIDFFQNNIYFARTWEDDFLGWARAQAELIRQLRHEHGRWVDYVIEFARGVDNIVDYFGDLRQGQGEVSGSVARRFAWYFDVYLQRELAVDTFEYLAELERYNRLAAVQDVEAARQLFLVEAAERRPDFVGRYEKYLRSRREKPADLLEYLMLRSEKLSRDGNEWMKSVLQVVRDTALYFQPQIRTKILNEGWASYWHDTLFQLDPHLEGHEVDYARVNAGVVSIPRVGMNPYAVGLRLFRYLKAKADRGMFCWEFDRLRDRDARRNFDQGHGAGREFIFDVRRYSCDANAIREYMDQDFCDTFKLFVTGKRIDREQMVWEYYVKSRKAEDYRRMMLEALYHPPYIHVDTARTEEMGTLHLVHVHEGKELVREYIEHTMRGIEFLWGAPVLLETHEIDEEALQKAGRQDMEKLYGSPEEIEYRFQRVRYEMNEGKLSRSVLGAEA